MFAVTLGLGIGMLVLLMAEQLYQAGRLSNEVTRKIIHIVSGLILVVWSFYISWQSIVIVESIFIVTVSLVRWLKLLGSQTSLGRLSWGEFFFPVGVILSIALGAPRWVFILAVLHLALADSAAALIGQLYGQTNSYSLFGQKKSVVGSAAFFVVSVLLVSAAFVLGPTQLVASHQVALWLLPPIATLAENVGVFGTDNLLIPLSVVWLLV